jgi:GDP-L-fucose synthase
MKDVYRLYDDARPDIVIHLAASVGGIGANMQNPGSFFYENLMMGTQMMEVGRQRKIWKFIAMGTVCSYPKITSVPFREEDLWNGYPEETNAPYGLAKKMMLVQSQAYRAQYNFNSIFLLPANLYGPRDNFNEQSSHVIPALIQKSIQARRTGQKRIRLWGTGEASREFLYVTDAAKAIVLASEGYAESQPLNIGNGQEIKIKDLFAIIQCLTKFKGEVDWNAEMPDGQPRRSLHISRMKEELGFSAVVSLEDGLRKTIEWYEKEVPAKSFEFAV